MEQEEYKREGIKWDFVEFPNNKEVIDLIEAKPTGILALLDEQCIVPKGTDQALAGNMYRQLVSHPRFEAGPQLRVDHRFVINHYAGDITYITEGFLEKNRDVLHQEGVNLLTSSDSNIILSLGSNLRAGIIAKNGGGKSSSIASQSVGAQFKNQLNSLLGAIGETHPHYVRCLKPNDSNVRACFDVSRITSQLANGGVLAAVHVARAGFPVRMQHAEFVSRYGILSLRVVECAHREAKRNAWGKLELDHFVCRTLILYMLRLLSGNGAVESLLAKLSPPSGKRVNVKVAIELPALAKGSSFRDECGKGGVQMGASKVFFRQEAFDKAEKALTFCLGVSCIEIQTCFRRHFHQRRYLAARLGMVQLQAHLRRRQARAAYIRALRCLKATLIIQTFLRARTARRSFVKLRHASMFVQTWRRANHALRSYREKRRRTLLLQCVWRKIAARRQLLILKHEAADASALRAKIKEIDAARMAREEERIRQQKEAVAKTIADMEVAKQRAAEEEARSKAANQKAAEEARVAAEEARLLALQQAQREKAEAEEAARLAALAEAELEREAQKVAEAKIKERLEEEERQRVLEEAQKIARIAAEEREAASLAEDKATQTLISVRKLAKVGRSGNKSRRCDKLGVNRTRLMVNAEAAKARNRQLQLQLKDRSARNLELEVSLECQSREFEGRSKEQSAKVLQLEASLENRSIELSTAVNEAARNREANTEMSKQLAEAVYSLGNVTRRCTDLDQALVISENARKKAVREVNESKRNNECIVWKSDRVVESMQVLEKECHDLKDVIRRLEKAAADEQHRLCLIVSDRDSLSSRLESEEDKNLTLESSVDRLTKEVARHEKRQASLSRASDEVEESLTRELNDAEARCKNLATELKTSNKRRKEVEEELSDLRANFEEVRGQTPLQRIQAKALQRELEEVKASVMEEKERSRVAGDRVLTLEADLNDVRAALECANESREAVEEACERELQEVKESVMEEKERSRVAGERILSLEADLNEARAALECANESREAVEEARERELQKVRESVMEEKERSRVAEERALKLKTELSRALAAVEEARDREAEEVKQSATSTLVEEKERSRVAEERSLKLETELNKALAAVEYANATRGALEEVGENMTIEPQADTVEATSPEVEENMTMESQADTLEATGSAEVEENMTMESQTDTVEAAGSAEVGENMTMEPHADTVEAAGSAETSNAACSKVAAIIRGAVKALLVMVFMICMCVLSSNVTPQPQITNLAHEGSDVIKKDLHKVHTSEWSGPVILSDVSNFTETPADDVCGLQDEPETVKVDSIEFSGVSTAYIQEWSGPVTLSNVSNFTEVPVDDVCGLNDQQDLEAVKVDIPDMSAGTIPSAPSLFVALERNSTEAIQLIKGGADIHARDKYGRTPLIEACHLRLHAPINHVHLAVVQALIERGADVNAVDKKGLSPLVYAAMAGFTEAVVLLLSSGADGCGSSKIVPPPSLYAKKEGHADTLAILPSCLDKQLSSRRRF